MTRTLRQAKKQEERQVEESKSEAEPFPGEEAAEYLEDTLSWTRLVLVKNKTETKIKTPGGPKLRPKPTPPDREVSQLQPSWEPSKFPASCSLGGPRPVCSWGRESSPCPCPPPSPPWPPGPWLGGKRRQAGDRN